MDPTLRIARIAGPVLATVGLGLLVNRAVYFDVAARFLDNPMFIYFSGVLLMCAGLAILNAHNAWTADWRSLVTVLGWVFTAVGAFRVLAPNLVSFLGAAGAPGALLFAGFLLLAAGSLLTFKGYVSNTELLP